MSVKPLENSNGAIQRIRVVRMHFKLSSFGVSILFNSFNVFVTALVCNFVTQAPLCTRLHVIAQIVGTHSTGRQVCPDVWV